jgi:radical SAM protein with 4Fe4S-binding SPASM domain
MQKLGKWGYQWRTYGKLRAANRAYDPGQDMAKLPFPMAIQLQTINACNAACTMCPYPLYKREFPAGRMAPELFDKVLEEIAERPELDTFIPMLQNEPFLDKTLFERIAKLKARTQGRVTVELVTNGAFLDAANIERIRESGLDLLDISLDAVSPEIYRKVRVGLDYERVMSGVERVLAAGLTGTEVFVRLVRLKDNMEEVDAFRKKWARRGVPVFVYTANNRSGDLEKFDERHRIPEDSLPLGQRMERWASRTSLGHCPFPFAGAFILHNGDVLACPHDWGRKELVGNVRDQKLAEIWNGQRMRDIRLAISERRYSELPACKDCSLWKDGWF